MPKIDIQVNNKYVPGLIPLLNSFRYYDVQANICLHDYEWLSDFNKEYLGLFGTVHVSKLPRDGMYYRGNAFKTRNVAAMGLTDDTLILDSDMVALNNFEEPFAMMKAGKFVGSCEFPITKVDQKEYDYASIGWQKLYPGTKLPVQFDMFNGGFLGIPKSQSKFLDDWVKATTIVELDHDYRLEQTTFSIIIRHCGLPIHSFDPELWMCTWRRHKFPKKFLSFGDDKKLRVQDESGRALGLYHFTGDVCFPTFSGPLRRLLFSDACNATLYEPNDEDFRLIWYDWWERRLNSPMAKVLDFMLAAGPAKIPNIYCLPFRKRVAELLNDIEQITTQHPRSERVLTICQFYDYIELLKYRLVGDSWINLPLKGLGCPSWSGEGNGKTIGWMTDADLVFPKIF